MISYANQNLLHLRVIVEVKVLQFIRNKVYLHMSNIMLNN